MSEDGYPSITVGICVRNCEETISQCIESVALCDYEKSKMEIIVVDGKSTDNTVEIARKLCTHTNIESRILSDEGKGLGYARQLVVDNANGEYVCWVDGDNVVTRGFLKSQTEFLEKNPSVGIAVPLILFDGNSIVAKLQGYAFLIPTLNALRKNKTPFLAMQGAIIALRTLKEIGGFNALIRGAGEDIELINRIIRSGYRVAVNPKALVHHNMRNSWKDLMEEISWWSRSQPRKRAKDLLTEVMLNFISCPKLTYDVIRNFNDPVGLLMPLYKLVSNTYMVIMTCT